MASFNPIQLVQAIEDIVTVYNALQEDGTLAKLVAAEQAVQTELANNAQLKDLLQKIEALK